MALVVLPVTACDRPSVACSEQSITAAQQEVVQQLGGAGLNLLVNNAGLGLVAPAECVPLQAWRQVLEVNLLGPLAITQVQDCPTGFGSA